MKTFVLVPTFDPFNFHWYTGVVPGFVAVAVKVTCVPGQTGFGGFDDIVIPAVTMIFTNWAIAFEIAGVGVEQSNPEVT